MSILMTLRVALKALGRNKMRTALTMLGMIIGVSAVITMVALGTGAQSSIESQIQAAGTNMIMVSAGNFQQGGVRMGQGNASTLTIAIAGLIVFGFGWGFFDCNNMPILCQIARPEWRATGYGIMNLVSISCGGFGDWGFGALRDRGVPLNVIFGAFAGVAAISIVIVLIIRPRSTETSPTTN